MGETLHGDGLVLCGVGGVAECFLRIEGANSGEESVQLWTVL
jgi:hypothetical protein